MIFSRHQKQHFKHLPIEKHICTCYYNSIFNEYALKTRRRPYNSTHLMKNLAAALSAPLSFWSMYSRITRMICTIATISEPNASVPRWYLNTNIVSHRPTPNKPQNIAKLNLQFIIYCKSAKANNPSQIQRHGKKANTAPHNQGVPKTAPEGASDGKVGQVLRLVKCPIIRSERSSHCHLTQRYDEVHDPEQHEQLKELQVDGKSVIE